MILLVLQVKGGLDGVGSRRGRLHPKFPCWKDFEMSVQVIAPPAADEPPDGRGSRVCTAPVVVPRRRPGKAHFAAGHPLARVARTRCELEHAVPMSARLGKTACAECWEFVIRTDERVAVEFDLPPLTGDDTSIVDEIAVELAVRGQRVQLTRMEKAEAVARMAAAGRSVVEVALRLRMNMCEVGKLWPAPTSATSQELVT